MNDKPNPARDIIRDVLAKHLGEVNPDLLDELEDRSRTEYYGEVRNSLAEQDTLGGERTEPAVRLLDMTIKALRTMNSKYEK